MNATQKKSNGFDRWRTFFWCTLNLLNIEYIECMHLLIKLILASNNDNGRWNTITVFIVPVFLFFLCSHQMHSRLSIFTQIMPSNKDLNAFLALSAINNNHFTILMPCTLSQFLPAIDVATASWPHEMSIFERIKPFHSFKRFIEIMLRKHSEN